MRTGFLAGLLLGWLTTELVCVYASKRSVVREDGEAWMDADTIFLHQPGRVA